MKKVFTLVAAILFVATSYAQLNVQEVKENKTPATIMKGVEKKTRTSDEGWISYAYYLENYWGEGTVTSGSGNMLQIDTTGLVAFSSSDGSTVYDHPWVLSIAQTYDFEADFFDLGTEEGVFSMTSTNSFTIDSISLGALYIRNANYPSSTKDTVIVGILTNLDREETYSFTNYDNTCFLYVEHDPSTGVQSDATVMIYKFPIDESNASVAVEGQEGYYYYADLEFPINLTNITGKAWHVAWTFKHGTDINMNDTLANYSYMRFSTWADPQTTYDYTYDNESRCENLSHGGYVCNFTNGMGTYYYPGFMLTSYHYPYMYLKVSCDDCSFVGLEEMEKENITVYPNPATSNITVNLIGDEKANIQLFNLVGQQVYSETATNSANINVSGLRSGVYMLKVTQNGKIYTSKVVVK